MAGPTEERKQPSGVSNLQRMLLDKRTNYKAVSSHQENYPTEPVACFRNGISLRVS